MSLNRSHIGQISFSKWFPCLLAMGALFLPQFLYAEDEDGKNDEVEQYAGDRISAYKQNKYRKDATRLALRLQSEQMEYTELNAEAPEDMVDGIYDALIAVHLSDLEGARQVTRIHKLHTFPVPSVDRFFVVYNRTATWATPLRLGDNTTNSEELNGLLEQYGLVIDRHVEWDEEHNSFNVRAKRSLNIAPIAKAFSKIDDIVLVDLLLPDGDGNDIEVKKLENGWELSYMVKFDSCISGCKKKHIWTFQVLESGQVQFVGESGDELPGWMTD
ncbi:MAG: hypothetical protein AAFP19_05260 [Bacteroidota bacterium]